MGRRADYGLDAPYVVRNLVVGGVAGVAAGSFAPLAGQLPGRLGGVLATVLSWGWWVAPVCFAEAVYMVWGSRVGKLRQRDRLLGRIPWRGDEAVLDVGCGRGLLLIGAARRLTAGGRAVGLDLWQEEDLSGNSEAAARANAAAEDVAERVTLVTGDMRQMPFPDAHFDVVVSSLAIHNVYDAAGRAQALREIARVLKPGGRALLQDIRHTAEYAAGLRAAGLVEVERSGLQWRIFPPARIVAARKPG
jgi:SAM-dependent methyltransferase